MLRADKAGTGARAVYASYQRARIGPDPLAEGACDWPAELTTGTVLHIDEAEPLVGWRMWSLHVSDTGPLLVAPFLTAVYGAAPTVPGVAWRAGVNRNSTYGCQRGGPKPHPRGNCRCGIRAVQSLTVLRAFAENQRARIGEPAVIARVEVFDRVAGYAPDDDWQHTLRAEAARIVGPLYVHPKWAGELPALRRAYDVEAEVGLPY